MKKILFILSIIIPTLLFAQKDSSHQAFKIGKCNPILANSYHDKDTCSLSVLIKYPFITVPCGNTINFTLSLPADGVEVQKDINGRYIPDDVLFMLKNDKYDCYIVIKDIHFKADDGSVKNARGMLIRILKK